MPYNNAPINPPEEITGSSSLPLARIKKIIQQDDEIAACSNSAAFAISVATEIFIRYLTEQSHNVVKSERKPRRNIAYKDVATAISRIDNLEFLGDVVPKTKTYRQFKEENRARDEGAANGKVGGARPASSNGVGASAVNGEDPVAGGTGAVGGNRSIQHMIQQSAPAPQANGVEANGATVNGHENTPHSPMADRTVGHGHPDPVRDPDVDMTG